MKKIISFLLLFSLCLCFFASCNKEKELQKFTDYSFDFFDTVTTIIGYETDKTTFDKNCAEIKKQLEEYHKLYDIYTFYDGVNNLAVVNTLEKGKHNRVTVDKKIVDLLLFCKEMHQKTNGKVNVASGSVLSIWHDYRQAGLNDPQNAKLPDKSDLKKASHHTNIDNLIIDAENNTVWLKDDEMSLDVGAIAKGYAVEQIGKYLLENNIDTYLLNVGGNVKALGSPTDKKWTIGIENPDKSDTENPHIEILKFEDKSLVTSGNYQRFYTVGGKNYNHIIDTATLFPAEYYNSVSIICDNSAIADALSTALFCMSVEDGKKLLENFQNIEVLWVKTNGEKIYTKNFKNYLDK